MQTELYDTTKDNLAEEITTLTSAGNIMKSSAPATESEQQTDISNTKEHEKKVTTEDTIIYVCISLTVVLGFMFVAMVILICKVRRKNKPEMTVNENENYLRFSVYDKKSTITDKNDYYT